MPIPSPEFFESAAAHCSWPSAERLRYYSTQLFRDVDLAGKRFLDVGGGSGIFTLYAAAAGARIAICIDSESDGSTSSGGDGFGKVTAQFGLSNATRRSDPFQGYDPIEAPFDIILLHNSINHLDEEACMRLREGGVYRERYRAIAARLAALASPNCQLILSDCGRRNFFHDAFGKRSPLTPTIEWHKHHEPEIWIELLTTEGFRHPKVRWTTPSRLGRFGSPLSARAIQYFLFSHFSLRMVRAPRA